MLQRRNLIVGGLASLALPVPAVARERAWQRDISLPTVEPGREIPVRVLAPHRGRGLPWIVFSHGAYSSGRLYDPILAPWAAAGFVVTAPTHRDSVSLGVARGSADPRYFGWRLEDMELLLRSHSLILERLPELRRRLDVTRIAATGHSFGGLVAQTIAGASYFDAAQGRTARRPAQSVRCALVFSGAGRMAPLLRSEDFAALRVPLLVTVGTEDLQQVPGLTGYQWRREPYDLAGSAEKWLLTLDGGDHYLGGLVGRDDLPHKARAAEWLERFNAVSLWFLQRTLRGRRQAPPPARVSPLDGPHS